MILREFQKQCLARVRKHWASGTKRVLVVSPTGSGKGTMAVKLLSELKPGERALFIVHSRDIVLDVANRLRAAGVKGVGVIAGREKRDDSARVQVCTVQSLANVRPWRCALVIVDEAHHYPNTNQWAKIASRFKAPRLVGFTATPERADGTGLGGKGGFEALDVAEQPPKLIADRHMVDCDVMIPERPTDGARALGPAEAYLRYAKKRPAFIYCNNVGEVARVTQKLRRAGVKAEAVTAKTDKVVRDAALADLRAGKLDCIVNYATMTEGVDAANVDCIVVGRKCRHPSAWVQMCGRGLRAYGKKKRALVLDLYGISLHPRFGSPTRERDFELVATEERGAMDAKPLAPGVYDVIRATGECANARRSTPADHGMNLVLSSESTLRSHGVVRVDTNVLDWSKPLHQLAIEAGVSKTHIARLGEWSGNRRPMRPRKLGIDWSGVDIRGRSVEDIAQDLGVNATTVYAHISKRADYVRKRRISWGDVLFDSSDSDIAKRLGVPTRQVAQQRRKRGIAVVETKFIDWDSDGRLGKMLDSELAERVGVSVSAVQHARGARGIAPFKPTQPVRRLGDRPWHRRFGKATDVEIAAEYGVTVGVVGGDRRRFGISSPVPKHSAETFRGVDWSECDNKIAGRMGLSYQAVKKWRLRLGHPPVNGRSRAYKLSA